jgi:hypothetical protein
LVAVLTRGKVSRGKSGRGLSGVLDRQEQRRRRNTGDENNYCTKHFSTRIPTPGERVSNGPLERPGLRAGTNREKMPGGDRPHRPVSAPMPRPTQTGRHNRTDRTKPKITGAKHKKERNSAAEIENRKGEPNHGAKIIAAWANASLAESKGQKTNPQR